MTKRNPTTWPLAAAAVLATSLLLAGCGTAEPDEGSPETTASQSPVAPETPTTETSDPDAEITSEEAAKIATEKYGGTVTSVESDTHNGEPTWEVEMKDTSEGQIEVDVSKATGEIVSFELEDD